MEKNRKEVKEWIILLIVVIILVLVACFVFLNLQPDVAESEGSLGGELASLWSGDPLSSVTSSTNPQCLSYGLNYKSDCLKKGYCICDDLYNKCYSVTSTYRDKDFATCRSRTFPATINGIYFRTLADCENAVISATYNDRNNCKMLYGWYGDINSCHWAVDSACKQVFGY